MTAFRRTYYNNNSNTVANLSPPTNIFPISKNMHGWLVYPIESFLFRLLYMALIASFHTLLRLLPSSRHTAVAVFVVEPLQDGGVRSHNIEITNQLVRAGRFLSRLPLSQRNFELCHGWHFGEMACSEWSTWSTLEVLRFAWFALRSVRNDRERGSNEPLSPQPANRSTLPWCLACMYCMYDVEGLTFLSTRRYSNLQRLDLLSVLLLVLLLCSFKRMN